MASSHVCRRNFPWCSGSRSTCSIARHAAPWPPVPMGPPCCLLAPYLWAPCCLWPAMLPIDPPAYGPCRLWPVMLAIGPPTYDPRPAHASPVLPIAPPPCRGLSHAAYWTPCPCCLQLPLPIAPHAAYAVPPTLPPSHPCCSSCRNMSHFGNSMLQGRQAETLQL